MGAVLYLHTLQVAGSSVLDLRRDSNHHDPRVHGGSCGVVTSKELSMKWWQSLLIQLGLSFLQVLNAKYNTDTAKMSAAATVITSAQAGAAHAALKSDPDKQ